VENISNTKIEKQKKDIAKTKAKIAEIQTKLREQEKTLRALEDLEIVARFRNMRGNEDFAAEVRASQNTSPLTYNSGVEEKEEKLNVNPKTE